MDINKKDFPEEIEQAFKEYTNASANLKKLLINDIKKNITDGNTYENISLPNLKAKCAVYLDGEILKVANFLYSFKLSDLEVEAIHIITLYKKTK